MLLTNTLLLLTVFAEALGNPIAYQSQLEKHAHQLEVLVDDDDENLEVYLHKYILEVLGFKTLG